jgi:hypothetical protein
MFLTLEVFLVFASFSPVLPRLGFCFATAFQVSAVYFEVLSKYLYVCFNIIKCTFNVCCSFLGQIMLMYIRSRLMYVRYLFIYVQCIQKHYGSVMYFRFLKYVRCTLMYCRGLQLQALARYFVCMFIVFWCIFDVCWNMFAVFCRVLYQLYRADRLSHCVDTQNCRTCWTTFFLAWCCSNFAQSVRWCFVVQSEIGKWSTLALEGYSCILCISSVLGSG